MTFRWREQVVRIDEIRTHESAINFRAFVGGGRSFRRPLVELFGAQRRRAREAGEDKRCPDSLRICLLVTCHSKSSTYMTLEEHPSYIISVSACRARDY